METIFLVKPVKQENINKNSFPPQNDPDTAKLSFSSVFKHFRENCRIHLFCVKKMSISE